MSKIKKALIIIPAAILFVYASLFIIWLLGDSTESGYTSLKEARKHPQAVEELYLTVGSIKPNTFLEFKNLERLRLSVKKEDEARYLKQWQSIRLSPKLKYLSLHYVPEAMISPLLKQVPNLEELWLRCIESEGVHNSLPPSLKKHKKLRKLEIAFCPYDRVPDGLTDLNRLESLVVRGGDIGQLPYDFHRLTRLKNLNINLLNALPPDFHKLSALETLRLGPAPLLDPFVELRRLPGLTELIIGGRPLLQDAIHLDIMPGDFPALKSLLLVNFRIKSLSGLNRLEHLSFLGLRSVQVDQSKAFWAFPSGIKQLELSQSGLRKVSPEIGTLLELRYLNLSHNCLQDLPSTFRNLKKLKSVNLQGNGIRAYPESLMKSPDLNYQDATRTGYYAKNCPE